MSMFKAQTRLVLPVLVWVLTAAPALPGFSGSDVFLPMAGRQAGVHPSNWYTTVWVHNPGADAVTARVYFLARNTMNPSPPSVDVTVAPGDTEKLENVIEEYFHLEAFGALRVTCPTKLVVTSRVYSKGVGADESDSVGQDFAGVPASFAIGVGEKAQILGTYQTLPSADSEFRFNFGFVETTGHAVTLRVTANDDNGTLLPSTDLQVREWSQRQAAFKDWFPDVSTENARLEVEVVSGSGKVIAYGSGIANGSQDATTFEMTYADSLLGIASVQHDATLTGDGTAGAPLGVKPSATAGQVLATVAGGSPSPGDELAAATTSVAWQSAGSLSLGLTAGGLTFGSSSGGLGQNTERLWWNNGDNFLSITGNLRLRRPTGVPASSSAGVLLIGDYWFLHGYGSIDNSWVGPSAGNFSLTGGGNTGVGYAVLNDLTNGNSNTGVGSSSLTHNAGGYSNTAIGAFSLAANTSGFNNVAAGAAALNRNETGEANTAVGLSSLYHNIGGDKNTALGSVALYSNTSGRENTALGANALYWSTEANGNTAAGYGAMNKTTSGSHNTAVGEIALWSNTSGARNAALGSQALWANVAGANNTAVGYGSLMRNIGGTGNTAVGYSALYTANAAANTAVGSAALTSNETGEANTAVGLSSLYHNIGGDKNTALGHSAGFSALGSDNVFLGYQAGYGEVGSHRLHIANSTASTLIYGQFDNKRVGVDTTSPTATLDVNGGVRVRNLGSAGVVPVAADPNGVLVLATPSDARLKRDVAPLGASIDMLAALAGLRGVSFSWDTAQQRVKSYGDRREIGLLAQEVEAVLPEVVTTGGDGFKSVDYARLTVLLVEIAKAQQLEIDALKTEVSALRR